ncbi:hypothetical protein GH714_026231 [Hevea brasiliensis]|uniref:Uncharacterized protein n=1 Tax=Hevea brasiliensis TaxID=3981 RepID=A0A6A6N4J2_HEVBR|nr:hypothetical protein GH714_026231 [Hevea brasiliensis]
MARRRGDKEDGGLDRHMGLLKLVQILSFLVVFVAGIIMGLATSSHISQYFTSQARLFFTNNIAATKIPGGNCTILRPCKTVDCLSMEAFLHPKNLTHSMTDKQLFWRASLMPTKEEYPFDRLPKVAFMFLTRGPLPMLPLWERFFRGHEKYFSIYIHTPPEYVLNVTMDSPFYRRQIPSQDVEWGTVSLVDAEKRLLANALLDFSNEPLLSHDDPSRYGRGRYNRKMLPDIKLFQWRKGSQWFEIQRALAVHIVSDTKYYAIFKKYCKPACYPDEHYIPTYLNMFHGPLNSNRTVTWVDWSLGGPHPATYRGINVTESFIQSIRSNGTECSYNSEMTSVCYLFARKFHPSALEPLLNLTSTVMEF